MQYLLMQPENSGTAFNALVSTSGDVSVLELWLCPCLAEAAVWTQVAQRTVQYCAAQQFQDISTAEVSAACIYSNSGTTNSPVALSQHSGVVL